MIVNTWSIDSYLKSQSFRYPRLNDEYIPVDVMSFKNG